MQIDHNPYEPSHKALKIIGVLTAVIVLAVAIPVNLGISWAVDLVPEELIWVIDGVILGLCVGFFLGRWDAIRQFRIPGRAE